MLLNDSIEFDNEVFPTVGAELVKMKVWHDIQLSDIWIPSELLPSRKCAAQMHTETSILFRKLEKASSLMDSFSVYEENQLNENTFTSGELLLDSLEEISSDIQFNQRSLSNSIPDLLEHLQMSDSESEEIDVEASEEVIVEHGKEIGNAATDIKCDSENVSSLKTVLEIKNSGQDGSADSLYLSDNVDNCWGDPESNLSEHTDKQETHESLTADKLSSTCIPNDFEGKDLTDEVIILPVAYQRPKEECRNACSDKRKPKKDKKPKKQTKNVPLDSFFMTEEEVAKLNADKFFDSLTPDENNFNEGPFSAINDPRGITVFPTFPERQKIKFVHDGEVKHLPNSCLEALNSISDSTSRQEKVLSAETIETPIHFSDVLKTILIENIPKSVNKEMLESLLQNYGEIKHIDFRDCKNASKAEVVIDIENVDWLIEGLNESQPFGIASSGALRCYEKNEK